MAAGDEHKVICAKRPEAVLQDELRVHPARLERANVGPCGSKESSQARINMQFLPKRGRHQRSG